MAQPLKDSFLDLERHRQLLESNVENLRKLLKHWQTWEAEYEGLKEEILAEEPSPNRTQLTSLTREYEGDLVKPKEIEDLLGPASRTAEQVVNLLDRRIDYVARNVATFQKQVEVAENKLAAATIISTPDVRNDEGLPITEIIEELDEEGNIVKSRTSTPGSIKPQLLEVLQKAGVKDMPDSSAPAKLRNPDIGEDAVQEAENKPELPLPTVKPIKKGVKFADNTKAGPESEKSQIARRVEEIRALAKETEKPIESPIVPDDESPEDAATRREMLQYAMSDVKAVVAELDLEEGSDWSNEDYDDADTDDEDQFGRSTTRVVDDEMRQRMIELEQRLGVRMMENAGKAIEPGLIQEGIGRIAIKNQESPSDVSLGLDEKNLTKEKISTANKKAVRFSKDIGISPASQTPVTSSVPANKEWVPAPVGDVVERTSRPEGTKTSPPRKVSRFKSNQVAASKILNGPLVNANPALPLLPLKPSKPRPFSQPITLPLEASKVRIAPSGPVGKTIASTVVERDVPADEPVLEPDELDPQLLHQELATEYHRQRNRLIQKQGGFMKEDESEIVPFTEEEGGPKKPSRFKAARLAKS